LQNRAIFGAYQDCPFACLAIQVKPDHTFVYRLDGDLYNDQRYSGTWSYTPDNRLHPIIPPKLFAVHESTDADKDRFRVTVVDEFGAAIQDALVVPAGASRELTSRTNRDGLAVIARCDEFEVRMSGYQDVHYRPANSESNEFTLTIPVDSLAIDEIWQVKGSRLYITTANGSIDKQAYLRKLSVADERKIFH
jgi:hypothetical protein